MTVEEILEAMEDLVLDSSRVPFTNKVIIEIDSLAKLIEDIRTVLPIELKEANRMVIERKQMLTETQKEAENMIQRAKEYAQKMAEESSITRQAEEQANEILLSARQSAVQLQDDSVHYADEVFAHIESNLINALEVVRQGRTSLHPSQKNDSSNK